MAMFKQVLTQVFVIIAIASGNAGATVDLPTSIQEEKTPPKYYVVKQGDNLTSIAQKLYGKDIRLNVNRIFKANRPMLRSPHKIYVGQKLVIPNSKDKKVNTKILKKAQKVKIHAVPGKYHPYYHIKFTLTHDNTELHVPLSERKPQYSKNNEFVFTDGGQFEVFVDKEAFPIPSPNFKKKYLILRMPWTSPDFEDSKQYITEKYRLFNKIYKMKQSGKGKVVVMVELNPYVNVLSKNPLKVELSGRNIFFRQAYGRYIDYDGPLKKM